MNAITKNIGTESHDWVREEIKRLEIERDGRKWEAHTSRGKCANTADLDKRIDLLRNCLPEWQQQKTEDAIRREAKRYADDVQALGSYTPASHVALILEQTQSLKAAFERMDLQGHARFAIRDLNGIEQALHATLSDYEASIKSNEAA